MAKEIIPVDVLLNIAKKTFETEFECEAQLAGIAPGRVNLIGEHTDYNEGFVFPMALPMVTIFLGKKNNSDVCRVVTCNENADNPRLVEFPVPTEKQPLTPGEPKWANYIKGVVQYFEGPKIGFDAAVISNVPLGGGLSSSAALEVSTYTFLEGLTGSKADPKQKAFLCQKAEHIFAHTPCGIMDQLIAIFGKLGTATLIDCRSLEISNIVIPESDCVFLITNSNVHHELASSEYSVRRQTCEEVARKMKKKSLRDVTIAELDKLNGIEALDEKMYKRAHHVISENERTTKAAKALSRSSLKEFGTLMYQSHDSLSKDYEVSCTELDQLVNIARNFSGVYGSRMTGGGFGGCTVTLVESSRVNDLIREIEEKYSRKADFYIVTASEGAYAKYF